MRKMFCLKLDMFFDRSKSVLMNPKPLVLLRKAKSLLCGIVQPLFILAFSVTVSAADTDIEWTGKKNQNLDEIENWSGEFPSSGIAYMSEEPVGDLKLDGSVFSLYRFWMRNLTSGVAFDLGKDRVFTMSNRMLVEGNSKVIIKSGTVGVALSGGDRLFVGDSTDCNKVTAMGADASLVAATLQVGTTGSNNEVLVEQGASAKTKTLISGRKAAMDNTVTVAGNGSNLEVEQMYIGNGEDSGISLHNGLVVSNNGSVAVSGCTILGNYGGRENYVEIGKDGSFSTDGYVYVGNSGSSNMVRIADGGVFSITNNDIAIGKKADAAGNIVEVCNGGELRMRRTSEGNNNLYVGSSGNGNVLRFDGGKLTRGGADEGVCIVIGSSQYADGNRLEILNGSSVDVSRIIVGDNSNDSDLVLSNATLRICGDGRCQFSANAGHTGNDFIIHGREARCIAREIDMGGNSKLVFNIPKEGFNAVPVELDDAVFRANRESPEIVINPPLGSRKGGWHTLIRIGGNYNLAECLQNFTVTAPEDVRVVIERTELKVFYSSNIGMRIVVR